MATTTIPHEDAVRTLADKIHGIDIAMMTTVEPDGSLHSRPMATQQTDFDGNLWFFTRVDSAKVDDIGRDHRVNLAYAEPSKQRYVSVSGTARMIRDRQKAEELWKPLYRAWFPEGLDDPSLVLLRVEVEKAEYWDSPSSAVVHLVGFVKALATGETYEPGENAVIDMQHR